MQPRRESDCQRLWQMSRREILVAEQSSGRDAAEEIRLQLGSLRWWWGGGCWPWSWGVIGVERKDELGTSAFCLSEHFAALQLQFEAVEVMLALVSDGQLSTAKAWAVELGEEAQVTTALTPSHRQFPSLSISHRQLAASVQTETLKRKGEWGIGVGIINVRLLKTCLRVDG